MTSTMDITSEIKTRSGPPFQCPAAGFTLIEVMVTLIILSIGILGWMTFQGSLIQGRAFSRDMTRAIELTNSKLDEFTSDITSDNSTWDKDHLAVAGTQALTMGNFPFTQQWNIRGTAPIDGVRQYWEIQVTTLWGKELNHSVTVNRVVPGK